MNKLDSIKVFSEKRSIIFSTFHKEDAQTALAYLEGYKQQLGPRNYVGLKGELNFYDKYRKEFNLVIGADHGDHTDFCGIMGGEMIRFDVTTNADYKKLKDYEKLQKETDAKYKIVVMRDGDVDEIIDINFPFCEECEKGRIMDIAFLLGENISPKGDQLFSYDQILVGACNYCGYAYEQDRITTGGLNDYATEFDYAQEEYRSRFFEDGEVPLLDPSGIFLSHSLSVVPYLHKQFDKPIIAMGQGKYVSYQADGEGDHIAEILWRDKHEIFSPYILDEYDFNPAFL